MHFKSRLNRDHMGSMVEDVVKMVGMGMDKGNKKITSLMIIKTSLVASVVLHIIRYRYTGQEYGIMYLCTGCSIKETFSKFMLI